MTHATQLPNFHIEPAAAKGRFRRRLLHAAGPFVTPGEVVEFVLFVRHGHSPLLNAPRLMVGARLESYVIVATDRSLLVLDVDFAGLKLVAEPRRLPRNSLQSVRRGIVQARAASPASASGSTRCS